MIIGHATVAFAIIGFAALSMGVRRRDALSLAVIGALFATIPDIDMLYAITGLLAAPSGGVLAIAESFWSASDVVHRSVTHSLVIAVPAAIAFTVSGRSVGESAVAALIGIGIVSIVWALSGPIAALVILAFAIAGIAIGIGALNADISRRFVSMAAIVGLLTHPFGDIVTGQPPALLYPLPISILDTRITLSADPTLHLLGAFAVELTAIWLGVYVFAKLHERNLRTHLKPHAIAGIAYAIAIFFVPPPTLESSYVFVFSVLGVGAIGATPLRRQLPDTLTAVTTGLAGITVAASAYLVAYILLDAEALIGQMAVAL